MSDKTELKACPFCGASARLVSNHDWHRIVVDHDEQCVFLDPETMMVPATDEQLAVAVADWNRRAALAQQPAPVAVPDGWQPKIVSGPGRSIFYGGNTNEHLNRPVVLLYADEYEKLLSTLAAPAAPVAVGQEPVKLSDDVLEFLQDGINGATQGEDDDFDFANQLAILLGPIYTAPPAAEQPDAVKVPRELLRRVCTYRNNLIEHNTSMNAIDELRDLLAEENKA